MSTTTNLKLFKHDNPSTNTNLFDVERALNDNWDKIDEDIGKKIYYYDNVQEMKNDEGLKEGMVCQTLGYDEANDGGAGLYKIIDGTLTEIDSDLIELVNGLIAKLVIDKNTQRINNLSETVDNIGSVESAQDNRLLSLETLVDEDKTGVAIKEIEDETVLLESRISTPILDFKIKGKDDSIITGNLNINVSTKNRLEISGGATESGLTGTINDDGSISIYGIATGSYATITAETIKTIKPGTYTFSKKSTQGYFGVTIRMYTNNNDRVDCYIEPGETSTQITISEKIVRYTIFIRALSAGTTYNDRLYLQLEEGELATNWVVPKSTQYLIGLGNIQLSSSEDFIYCDGNDYYVHNESLNQETKITDSTLKQQLDNFKKCVTYNETNYLYCNNDLSPIFYIKYLVATWINNQIYSNENVLYFSTKFGDDRNEGTEKKPKKNPSIYVQAGNCSIKLRSGDTFYLDDLYVGENTMISTYGGKQKAIINGSRQSSGLFTVTANSNIYQIQIDATEIGAVRLENDEKWNWKRKVTNNLQNDGEYYFDRTTRILYMYSITNIEGKKIHYWLGVTALTITNSNVVIDDIEVKNYGVHGIRPSTNSNNICVSSCYIHDIGGSILPSGSAKLRKWSRGLVK